MVRRIRPGISRSSDVQSHNGVRSFHSRPGMTAGYTYRRYHSCNDASRFPRNAEMAFQRRWIGLQRAAGRIMHDDAAFQYHGAVGQSQNLLSILLDDDGADAAGPRNGAERP